MPTEPRDAKDTHDNDLDKANTDKPAEMGNERAPDGEKMSEYLNPN